MNFSDIVKKNSDVKPLENIQKPVEVKEVIEYEEPIESKWSGYFNINIIDLFSDIKYDFNILLDKCDINNFFDFVISNSTIYDPYNKQGDSESEDDEELEYISD